MGIMIEKAAVAKILWHAANAVGMKARSHYKARNSCRNNIAADQQASLECFDGQKQNMMLG